MTNNKKERGRPKGSKNKTITYVTMGFLNKVSSDTSKIPVKRAFIEELVRAHNAEDQISDEEMDSIPSSKIEMMDIEDDED